VFVEPIKVIRGMRDILPEQAAWWQRMERKLLETLHRYGYGEIRTPVLEPTELFKRSIGEETDIVAKEMYTFGDRDGSSLTMRPEGTAAVVRSYIAHTQWKKEPVTRWYYLGPMFRHERPQKGRYRQFYQVGVELLGAPEPAADVEMIDVMVECMRAIGLEQTSLQLNSLGDTACRPAYRQSLVTYLGAHREELCPDCKRRLETNPLRVLDCKEERCVRVAGLAPRMLDFLCDPCREHFETVQKGLSALSLPFEINHRMVRGLDYYTRTTFELLAEGLGAQNAVAAGGRYDRLVTDLGGPDVPGLGFAAGLDRILLKLMDTLHAPEPSPSVFFVTRGEEGWRASLALMQELRRAGIRVESDVRQASMKAQMKRADKSGARFVVMVGEDELATSEATVRDLAAPADVKTKQFPVPFGKLRAELQSRVRVPAAGEDSP
jgi:histidyl-tRNA synthetase